MGKKGFTPCAQFHHASVSAHESACFPTVPHKLMQHRSWRIPFPSVYYIKDPSGNLNPCSDVAMLTNVYSFTLFYSGTARNSSIVSCMVHHVGFQVLAGIVYCERAKWAEGSMEHHSVMKEGIGSGTGQLAVQHSEGCSRHHR